MTFFWKGGAVAAARMFGEWQYEAKSYFHCFHGCGSEKRRARRAQERRSRFDPCRTITRITRQRRMMDLGICPTRQHATGSFRCGFTGCVDLRPWAEAHRYRFRMEASFGAENSAHVKGDGRWYVEVLCRYGLIYPKGGDILLAYATSGVKRHLAAMSLEHHQYDGNNEVFRVPVGMLDEVAAILKPKRRRASFIPSPEQLRALREGRERRTESGQTGLEPCRNEPERVG